jgi:hypothetical protein
MDLTQAHGHAEKGVLAMVKLLSSVLIVSALAGTALAEEQSQQSKWSREGVRTWEYTRFIPANVKRRVGFGYWVATDECVGATDIEFRVTKAPEHGAVESLPESGFPNFAKDSPRAKCNGKKIRGVAIYYKPEKDFKGTDEFEVILLYPSGFADEAKFSVNVQ